MSEITYQSMSVLMFFHYLKSKFHFLKVVQRKFLINLTKGEENWLFSFTRSGIGYKVHIK